MNVQAINRLLTEPSITWYSVLAYLDNEIKNFRTTGSEVGLNYLYLGIERTAELLYE